MFFKNYSQKIDKICDHEFDKSLLSLSVSDSELSAELLQSLSELKSVLEVAELSLDSDSEVSRSEFGIFMAKFVIFWPPISTVPYTINTVNERPSSTCASMGNSILEKLGGHKSAKPCEIYTQRGVIGNDQ